MARIEDYALIGDCETAALVGRDGSIDWLCWPNFASEACFASILGSEKNGFWKISPDAAITSVTRQYREHTLVLETRFATEDGEVLLIDFMPKRGKYSNVVRIIRGMRGKVDLTSTLCIRFGYGSVIPWVTSLAQGAADKSQGAADTNQGEADTSQDPAANTQGATEPEQPGIRAVAGPDTVVLRTPVEAHGEDFKTICRFTVSEGESIPFVLTYGDYGVYNGPDPPAIHADDALASTEAYWNDWASRCPYEGRYREEVERSLITLKALTYKPTGGVVAAPTMALPEELGGPRNWDYRYCWLRDTTFTLLALMNGGYFEEAEDWLNWLLRTVAGSPEQVQIMYGIHGERTLTEWIVSWLPGYENSAPVRAGNAAAEQVQLDIYGEVLDAFYLAHGKITRERDLDFHMVRGLIHHLEGIWQKPDNGIWETRGGPKQFVYSKVMAWVAFDRAIKLAEEWDYADAAKDSIDAWKLARDQAHQEICEKGFSKKVNSFTQYYGTDDLDASALIIAQVGFLPLEDPRIIGTIEAIEKHLTKDGFVLRYDTSKGTDGLSGNEGAFLACSFWLVSCLALIGRGNDAKTLFDRLLALSNDVGLLSEEYDVGKQRLVGNFPQAFSHIALISAAYTLEGQGERQRHEAPQQSAGSSPDK